MGTVNNSGRKPQEDFKKFSRHGMRLPRQKIFATVKQLFSEETGATNKEIAEILEITPQSCSTLASGSDRRQPPFCIILRLLDQLGMGLLLTGEGVEIVPAGDGIDLDPEDEDQEVEVEAK